FENKELEAGLRAFLRPLNHVFIWKPAHAFVVGTVGGSGPYRLSEIQVFRPGQPGRMIFLDERPDPAARQVPAETGFETQDRETKIIIKGNRVYVPVVIAYNRQQVATTLIFDTGAGDIVLHHDLADRLGINDGKRAKGHGVGGIEIDALVTRLSSVKVGPYEKQNLRAAVVQYQGPEDTHYNGLLGMNFLRGMNYKIDFERSVIRWGAADQSPEP
ncbi:MAG: retroviral-like aspartic protease family protein, partial [Desulfatitalea sp.]|nr:retroviral-like aspartic protease family protein [Desulfatitalea sp.]